MKSKTILSTAAFIVAFAASAAFASLFITKTQTATDYVSVSTYKPTSCFRNRNNATTANKISALIRADKSNGRESGRRLYSVGEDERPPFASSKFPGYAEAVERYAQASSSMKPGDLPEDFQTEWREHMKAWSDYSDFLNRMKTASNRTSWSSAELEEVDDFHSREIDRTWQVVLQAGVSYGADVY